VSMIVCGTAPGLCHVDECVSNDVPETVADAVDWTDVQPIIEQCAKRASWKFRQYVEPEDCLQTGWLYYFENRRQLDALMRDPFGLQFVKRRIQSACNDYALKEMCARTGVQWEDQYRYSRGEVRFMIQLGFGGGLVGGESANTIVGMVDVARAYHSCSPEDKDVLYRAYGPDREDSQLSSTERGRVHRAVARIQAIANGEQPPESHAEPRS
jgi:hypothetical protein